MVWSIQNGGRKKWMWVFWKYQESDNMIVKLLKTKRKEITLTLILIYVLLLLFLKPYEWSFYVCTIVLVVCLCIYRIWYHRQNITD